MPVHIISLGAGVQSSTMALMAAAGELTPMPKVAIFADTQNEPAEVYHHLERLRRLLPFPILTTTKGNLAERYLAGFEGARMPFYIKAGGISTRQCTREFKIRPIRRKVREALLAGPRTRLPKAAVIQWIGISTNEADRQKPSGVQFIVNRWPLLEDGIEMSRTDCERWLWDHYRMIAPKSACKQCPYQEPERLLRLKEQEPREFAELCNFDAALRTPEQVARFRGELFVHPSCQPLIQVDLAGEVAERAAKKAEGKRQGNLFSNECEGMCGV